MREHPGVRSIWIKGSLRIHSGSQLIRDGAFEQPGGVGMKGLQRTGGQCAGHISAHGEVHIKDEFHFRILCSAGSVVFDASGAGVDLGLAAGIQLHLQIAGAERAGLFLDITLLKGTGVGRGKQVCPVGVLQPQPGPGDNVHVPQSHPLEERGMVDADERGQGLVQLTGKGLPAGIAQRGERNEILRFQTPSAERKL